MARLASRCALACLLLMTLVLPARAAPRIWVAMSEGGGAYAEAAAVLRTELGADIEIASDAWQTLFDDAQAPPDLIVTVGVAALDGTLERLARLEGAWLRTGVLAILLPQAVFNARQASVARRAFSAVVLDQPLGRQLALIRRALPERLRVGILPGPQTQPLLAGLQKEAAARGMALAVAPPVTAVESIYPALKSVLDDAQVILALPDPVVYNAASLQNLLLTTYRARVPLVAFSAAYVKAGATLALYSTPAQVARRGVEMARGWIAGRGLPAPQSPREFSVAVNARVAASLGLALDDAAQIAEDLRRQEAGR